MKKSQTPIKVTYENVEYFAVNPKSNCIHVDNNHLKLTFEFFDKMKDFPKC
jgi:hypothetical protein